MKQKVLSGLALFMLVVVGLLLPAPASAEPTTRCKSVSVGLTDRLDNGSHGTWAKDTMTRTLTVCLDNEAGAPEGKAYYVATVVDKGTFTTVEGKSPKAGVPLAQGIAGTVNGGFRVPKFTAPKVLELSAPDPATTSGEWVSTAVKGAEGATIGSYRWAYATACETYVDDNDVYTGDITVHCVTPTAPTYTAPTCTAYGIVKLPEQDGVKYNGRRVDGKAVVTATAEAGYAFPKGTKAEWAYDVAKLTEGCESPSPSPSASSPTPDGGSTPPQGSSSPTPPSGTPTASSSPSVGLTPVGGAAGSGGLPVTGAKVLIVAGVGGLLVAIGGLMLVGLRRRAQGHGDSDTTQQFSAI